MERPPGIAARPAATAPHRQGIPRLNAPGASSAARPRLDVRAARWSRSIGPRLHRGWAPARSAASSQSVRLHHRSRRPHLRRLATNDVGVRSSKRWRAMFLAGCVDRSAATLLASASRSCGGGHRHALWTISERLGAGSLRHRSAARGGRMATHVRSAQPDRDVTADAPATNVPTTQVAATAALV